ncbi:6783_t:CDS:1, partial [Paraglomus occultum]
QFAQEILSDDEYSLNDLERLQSIVASDRPYISAIKEWRNFLYKPDAEYDFSRTGSDHESEWYVTCSLDGKIVGTGTSRGRKQEAKSRAAASAIRNLLSNPLSTSTEFPTHTRASETGEGDREEEREEST